MPAGDALGAAAAPSAIPDSAATEPLPLAPAPPAPVPAWLTMPILDVAIPHSPFAWGGAVAAGAPPAMSLPAAATPEMVGFGDAAPALAPPPRAAPRPFFPALVVEPEAPEEAAAPADEPAGAPSEAALDVPEIVFPVEIDLAMLLAEPAPPPASEMASADPPAEVAAVPAERLPLAPATMPPDAAAPPPRSLAEQLRRRLGEAGAGGTLPPGMFGQVPRRPLPLPLSRPETRPSAGQRRSERPIDPSPSPAGAVPVAAGEPAAVGRPSNAEMPPAGTPLPGPRPPLPRVPAIPASQPRLPPLPETAAPRAAPPASRAASPPLPAGQRNRRLYRRVALTAELEIDGVPCGLLDLSMGGFATIAAPRLPAEAVVPVTVRMNIDGIDIGTRMNARVIYASENRAGGHFVDLTPSQTAFLRYVVTWRGQSVGAVGTTTLLDAITRWPDRSLTGEVESERPVKQGFLARWVGRLLPWRRR